jgi:hypothetical protein
MRIISYLIVLFFGAIVGFGIKVFFVGLGLNVELWQSMIVGVIVSFLVLRNKLEI